MTTPALRLNVFFASFPYGGNGGVASEIPQIRHWQVETTLKMSKDPRVGDFITRDFTDTPVYMTRNAAILTAKAAGAHLLLMVDSDNDPNRHAGEPWFRPFWDEAFNFIYNNYHRGPRLVFAPYVGPGENIYVFQWQDGGSRSLDTSFSLEQYSRQQAAIMTGIQEAAAGPTGLILIDLRLCDLIEPSGLPEREVLERVQAGSMTVEEGQWALKKGYFYYEYENSYAAKKASTEDVTFTRDISLAGVEKLGYNPVFCAWNSWVGHYKPINLGRPQRFTAEHVNTTLRRAVIENASARDAIVDLSQLNQGDDPLCLAIRQAARPTAHANGRQHKSNGHAKANGESPRHCYGNMQTRDAQEGAWHEHGGAPDKHKEVLQDLVRAQAHKRKRGIRVLEVGTWLGGTAIAMADADDETQVHCVDTWQGTPSDITAELVAEAGGSEQVYEEFVRRVGSRLNTQIFPWRMPSDEAAQKHWDRFDIVFIDGDHTYEGCRGDILNWWPHLRDDGIMVGHDYMVHGYSGLTQAVNELFGDKVETIGWHPQGAMWLVRKADCPLMGKEAGSGSTEQDHAERASAEGAHA